MDPIQRKKLHSQALDLLRYRQEKIRTSKLFVEYGKTHDQGGIGGPYKWQVEFHGAGAKHHERMILAGNRVGKSRSASAEVAIHAIGWYPDWWEGRRYDKPVEIGVISVTNELSKKIAQTQLVGNMGEGRKPDLTGWIPAEHYEGMDFRTCSVSAVAEQIRVKHMSGGISRIWMMSYEQEREKLQGVSWDIAWMDEEPRDYGIFSEIQTRVFDRDGMVIVTFTPLLGTTKLVKHFKSGGPGIYTRYATWDDVSHFTESQKARQIQNYPEHERDARTRGIPMLGSGGVYPISDSLIMCDPFKIPSWYQRLVGIDFGMNHKFGAVWIAYDPDSDIIYVTDCYSMSYGSDDMRRVSLPAIHVGAIRPRGAWIPVAWPHDGQRRDAGSGERLKDLYQNQGLNMLPFSARYDDMKGSNQPVEPVVNEILERMHTGRFLVFRNLAEWFEEKNSYHRDDGKIVARDDDLMAATRYAVMMKRYARSASMEKRVVNTLAEDYDYDPLGV